MVREIVPPRAWLLAHPIRLSAAVGYPKASLISLGDADTFEEFINYSQYRSHAWLIARTVIDAALTNPSEAMLRHVNTWMGYALRDDWRDLCEA